MALTWKLAIRKDLLTPHEYNLPHIDVHLVLFADLIPAVFQPPF